MTGPVDVLAVGAHPDDVEVGCGGTLLLATASGLRIAACDLTAGEMGSRGTREDRSLERKRAAAMLNLAARPALDLPDSRLGTSPEHREALVAVIQELQPKALLAPHTEDGHPDHAAAGRMAREAAYLARLTLLGPGRPHRPQQVLHYMLNDPFEPTILVDISSVWERKVQLMNVYESQFAADGESESLGPRFLERVAQRADLYGSAAGVERAEPFFSPDPVTLPGLPL